MILLIDTNNPDTATLRLLAPKLDKTHEFKTNFDLSERLTGEIAKFLRKHKLKMANLSQIGVFAGPGHFSRIRTAVATANALAYALEIPVVGLAKNASNYSLTELQNPLKKGLIKPIYDKPPNITKAKLDKFSK